MSALRLKITFSVFFFTYLLFAQENTINIGNDHLQLYKLINGKDVVFYEVQNKEVQFPVMEWKEIPNPRYVALTNEAEGNYARYKEWLAKNKAKEDARTKFVNKIEEYLSSSDRYKEKVILLQEADSISRAYNFLEGFDGSEFRNKQFIYDEKKRPDTGFLNAVLKYQRDLQNTYYGIGYTYQKNNTGGFTENQKYRFKQLEDELERMPKTTKGLVLSENSITKNIMVYVDEDYPLSDLTLKFTYNSSSDYNLVSINVGEYRIKAFFRDQEAYRIHEKFKGYSEISPIRYEVIFSEDNRSFITNAKDNILSYFKSINEIEGNPFYFVKSTIERLNYFAKVRNDGEFSTALNKKKMTGMYELPNLSEAIDYDELKYISFNSLDLTEKFIVRTPFKTDSDMDLFMIIQSLRTKKYYVVNNYLFNLFQNYNHMGDEEHGNGYIFKRVPKEITAEEKALYNRFMTLVNQGKAKSDQIEKVLKKYPLRNMNDVSRISKVDKQTYNRLLKEMRKINDQARDILNYEDENKWLINKLSIKEIAKYEQLGHDCYNLFEINF
ncbi:hypothetical protein [Myroides sp. N17-2]|uniref:hypothetical protein n=1 Tax=Myroides sp. N17-2 TaxID=2030799 RepID=UPI000EFC79F5|nr:hypothetical protein [Myroides sp. N17-2]